jgi:hypothetical protein
MFGKSSNKSSYADKLLDEARKHWKQRQYCFQKDNDEGIEKECLEAIRLCQLSIEANPLLGDAYVLLADACLSLALHVTMQANPDSYEFFMAAGAAVISEWCTFPNERYSSSEVKETGERMWRVTIGELMQDREQSQQDVLAYIDLARSKMADAIISPTFFQVIKSRLATANRDIAPLHRKGAKLRALARLGEINSNELIAELSGSMQMAKDGSQHLESQGDTGGAFAKWWLIFLNHWGGKCINRWSANSYGLKDYVGMQNLWLNYFEPLWLVGCEITKIAQLNRMIEGTNPFISGLSHPADAEDKEKLNKWLHGSVQVANKIIDDAKIALRQTITDGLENIR